jgi:hypothetical protein
MRPGYQHVISHCCSDAENKERYVRRCVRLRQRPTVTTCYHESIGHDTGCGPSYASMVLNHNRNASEPHPGIG